MKRRHYALVVLVIIWSVIVGNIVLVTHLWSIPVYPVRIDYPRLVLLLTSATVTSLYSLYLGLRQIFKEA
ncbi:hypothetical protein KEJ21_02455 [Candidatus Bathyarchaeota archaeon]|nr:hypothetical protein [Candidatus Bathyarchaeota archaeon]MBS7630113.1 hypothetical protein [Candidatus Bathyarchaeota archaeon]